MTTTKKNIVAAIRSIGFSKTRSIALVEALIEIIKHSLENGEEVAIRGFGTFSAKRRKRRNVLNPRTSELMILPEKRVVRFISSQILRKKINERIMGSD